MRETEDIKLSKIGEKALADLEKVEIEWSADEITIKKATGRMILHLKNGHSGTA